MTKAKFEWNPEKNIENQHKHNVPFELAQYAFADSNRIIAEDHSHSQNEKRYFCFGLVAGEVITVRFTMRGSTIRIFGAGYWRKGKRTYDNKN